MLETRRDAMKVPFLDLAPTHAALKDSVLREIADLVDSGAFTNGPQVAVFERFFADYCATVECVGLASGLDALRLGLLSLGLEPGDEVIVPAMTFVATYEAVTQAGGVPVPADIGAADHNLDSVAADAAVTSRTRALLPVHLYGQLADLRELCRVAERHGLELLEDACQAHGAERDGRRAGAGGAAAAFSFYPGKNLGAWGDAGALVTNDARVATCVRALREHGQREKYRHEREGYTARLDTLQAIVLANKLPLLDGWNEQRCAAARFYDEALAGIGDIVLPPVPPGSRPVWHLYAVQTSNPNALAGFLAARGISTGRHYPEAPHLSPAYAHLGYRQGSYPVAEQLAERTLSLPLFPGISEAHLAAVVDAVRAFFAHG